MLGQARRDPLVDKMGNPLRGKKEERVTATGVNRLGKSFSLAGAATKPATALLGGGKATATMPGRKAGKSKVVDVPMPPRPEGPQRARQGRKRRTTEETQRWLEAREAGKGRRASQGFRKDLAAIPATPPEESTNENPITFQVRGG